MRVDIICILLVICVTVTTAKSGYGPGEQDWGFFDVRKGAHMFYWLYYTTANVTSYTQRPLAIWLQGGPGASATGYGNFEELGPLDLYGLKRNHSWVQEMNVLFIDNPVGSGFSYVDNLLHLTKNNNEIALDLVSFMKGFYQLHPEFETVPLHIFCESYGGKMAPEFALELYNAIQRGDLRSNFKSVALGDPWTSPIDSVLAWAPLLLQMGIVDQDGFEKIAASAAKTEELIKEGKWMQATNQWGATETIIAIESKGVDFYNIERPTKGDRFSQLLLRSSNIQQFMYRTMVQYDVDEDRDQILDDLMRGPVTRALNVTSGKRWGSQSSITFTRLQGDFMKPVVHIVEKLLNYTNLKVGVYSGQLDLICATPGTVNWVNKMQWSYKSEYTAAPRIAINVNRVLEGYERSAGNFTMLWINRAGHMVPEDNPAGMSYILRKYTNFG
ncbi:retinoid-inducible serine carboxypeptidase-like [Eurosta solidaginis]|uniref:retinoid-inducible serine carboxypeptidase-like n=1 Tax=Eurosta solidaginis TaxID=178769 RepID=UPI0035311589